MRDMRGNSIVFIRERSIVSCLDFLLLVLGHVGFGELDEFVTFYVHPLIVLIIGFVANPTLDMCPPYSRHSLHIQSFHQKSSFLPSCDEFACFYVEKQS
jgi:hypothetical protein